MTARRSFLYLLLIVVAIMLTLQGHFDPQGSNGIVGKAQAAPLQQDLPTVSFDRTSINVTEPDSGETEQLTLNVEISVAPNEDEVAKVTYKCANLSAVAGED